MNIKIRVVPDYHSRIYLFDDTNNLDSNPLAVPYMPETSLLLFSSGACFKYSDTCTVDVLKKVTVDNPGFIVDEKYLVHDSYTSDSQVFDLTEDGYYIVSRLVLPTEAWLQSVMTASLTNTQVITDLNSIFSNGLYIIVTEQFNGYLPGTILEVNPSNNFSLTTVMDINYFFDPSFVVTNTSLSMIDYDVFSIDKLKHCYINIGTELLNSGVKLNCLKIDPSIRFNRDFIMMTISVINFLLDENDYYRALQILERLSCYNFCNNTVDSEYNDHGGCGCHKH